MAQHLEALERANVVRIARAELKRAVKAGDVMAAEVLLAEVPDWLEQLPLEELCNAIPRFGWRHYQRLMQETHTGLTATIRQLTPRKRKEVAEGLAEWEAAAAERRARPRRIRARADGARRRAA